MFLDFRPIRFNIDRCAPQTTHSPRENARSQEEIYNSWIRYEERASSTHTTQSFVQPFVRSCQE
jgi:hypothetical protein